LRIKYKNTCTKYIDIALEQIDINRHRTIVEMIVNYSRFHKSYIITITIP